MCEELGTRGTELVKMRCYIEMMFRERICSVLLTYAPPGS